MRKEYVVVRIDAAPDAAPYVVVSLSSKKDVQDNNGPLSSPFGKTKTNLRQRNFGPLRTPLFTVDEQCRSCEVEDTRAENPRHERQYSILIKKFTTGCQGNVDTPIQTKSIPR